MLAKKNPQNYPCFLSSSEIEFGGIWYFPLLVAVSSNLLILKDIEKLGYVSNKLDVWSVPKRCNFPFWRNSFILKLFTNFSKLGIKIHLKVCFCILQISFSDPFFFSLSESPIYFVEQPLPLHRTRSFWLLSEESFLLPLIFYSLF